MGRQLHLFIAMSIDGYIATRDENLDFLSIVEVPGEDYGYADFNNTVDTVILGRKTFDKVLTITGGNAYPGKKVYVISRSRTGSEGSIDYRADLVDLVTALKKKEGKNIYCDGGSEVIYELLKHRLIDHMIISVIPHLLGDGIHLFREGLQETRLRLKRSTSFPSGLVQLWYEVQQAEQSAGTAT